MIHKDCKYKVIVKGRSPLNEIEVFGYDYFESADYHYQTLRKEYLENNVVSIDFVSVIKSWNVQDEDTSEGH